MSWVLKTSKNWSQGSHGGSYFTGAFFAGSQRRAVRFGKRVWAQAMARILKRYGVRVVRIRRVREIAK